jgi:hypothetical protein
MVLKNSYILLLLSINLLASDSISITQKEPKAKKSEALLSRGKFYGDFRLKSFVYHNRDRTYAQEIVGAGGSLGFKSDYLYGLGFTAVAYSSWELWHGSMDEVSHYKSSKDILSRYRVSHGEDRGIKSLAQAFLEYHNEQNSLKFGRQLFQSFLTNSNDTKMIPNAFFGFTAKSTLISDTQIKLALLTKQKLRDHENFHHLLAYGDDPNDPYAKWRENDDGAMHRGLTLSKLKDRGIEDYLLVMDLKNSSLRNSTLYLNYTLAPSLLAYWMMEGSYQFAYDDLRIIPSIRYMRQFDNGAGAIGGANLRNNTIGYRHPKHLDGELYASRIDFVDSLWRLRFGYSTISDDGDLVAPWRGFPTGGYSRAMGQYNWYANTDSYMVRIDYNLGQAGWLPHTKAMMRYVIQDFDDNKAGVQSDSQVFTLDLIKKRFAIFDSLSAKIRVAHVVGEDEIVAEDGTLKSDPSYNEVRLEFSYLF